MQDDNVNPIDLTGKALAIAALNDVFRKSFSKHYGIVRLSEKVAHLSPDKLAVLTAKVRLYDFPSKDERNDPYNEHDFGTIELFDDKFFWKIDYFDESLKYHSENPVDNSVTIRVLQILYANEY